MTTGRLQYLQESAWKRDAKRELRPIPPFELPVLPGSTIIDLPEPDLLPEIEVNFLEMVELRSTIRTYDTEKPLTQKELSYLLWCTQGVKDVVGNKTVRNVPSAGGRNPLETFMYINRVEGIEPGIYRFLPLEHKLVLLTTDKELCNAIVQQFSSLKVTSDCAVLFIWVGIYERTACMFGERAFRYIYLDAGHVCENLYYAGQTMNIKTCPLGAFDDEVLNRLLGLDGDQAFVVYGAAVGK